MYTIIPASEQDFPFAHDLTEKNMRSYVNKYWGGWSRTIFQEYYQNGENFIIIHEQTKIGYIRIRAEPPVLYLDDMQIDETFRNRGIGTWALGQIESMALERQCNSIRLRVFHDNPARRFYQRCGFRVCKTLEHAVIMQKDILISYETASSL